MGRILSTLVMLAFPAALFAQTPLITSNQRSLPAVLRGEGWEAFPNVEYQGGDATQSEKRKGMLVLTDTTFAFYECEFSGCLLDKKKSSLKEPAIWLLPLKAIKEVSSSSNVRGSTLGGKLMLGGLAGDRTEEFLGFVYESETSAESPVFKTQATQSGAIEAKVKFRLKKLGVELANPPE